jgi:hypothetical protein
MPNVGRAHVSLRKIDDMHASEDDLDYTIAGHRQKPSGAPPETSRQHQMRL